MMMASRTLQSHGGHDGRASGLTPLAHFDRTSFPGMAARTVTMPRRTGRTHPARSRRAASGQSPWALAVVCARTGFAGTSRLGDDEPARSAAGGSSG